MQPSELAALGASAAERTKKVNYPVVHLTPHFIRRTMLSAVAGCQLFLVAGPEPVSYNPKAPQLLLLTCRQATGIVLGSRLTVEVQSIRVDVTSVYTGASQMPAPANALHAARCMHALLSALNLAGRQVLDGQSSILLSSTSSTC